MEKTVDWLENGEDHSFYLIGDKDRKQYYPAIIGLAKDYSHVVYSRDILIDCFMKANDWSWDEAVEWIEYNVERALPYYGAEAPKILNAIAIYPSNKKYIPLKIILD